MKWNKLGLVYVPDGYSSWNVDHAYCPTPEIRHDRVRVYFAGWDKEQRGRVGFVDLALDNPQKVINISKEPVLDLGQPGMFDCDGVAPSQILYIGGGRTLMYYFGFQRTGDPEVTLIFCGLAQSVNNGPFKRLSNVPVLERTRDEAFLRSTVFVMKEDVYRCWYTGSISGWESIRTKGILSKSSYPKYTIKYIHVKHPYLEEHRYTTMLRLERDEFAIARPWVIKEEGVYKMWFSKRSPTQNYRMGYAVSDDGYVWKRSDHEVGIDVSNRGFDSEMVCFGAIFDVPEGRFMLYNGNKHGADGFGLARLEE